MAVFEVEINGKRFEVEAPTQQAAIEAIRRMAPQPQETPQKMTPEGVPEGMVFNPYTNQYTSRELIAGNLDRGRGGAAQIGAMQGISFGGADELMGGVNAAIPGPGTAGQRYDFGREFTRAAEDRAREDYPYTTGASEIVGAVGTAALTYPAAAGGGLLSQVGRGAAVGGAEGLGYGFLSGEGSAEERAKNALKFALFGGAVGGAAPVAVASGKKAFDVASDVVGGAKDAALNKPAMSRANRALAKTAKMSGKTADEIQEALDRAAREGQPEYVLADALGVPGQRRLSAVARSGGDGSAEIAEYLDTRQAGQPERVAATIEDAFDLRGSTAKAARTALESGRKESADIAFDGIRGTGNPVDVRRVVDVIDTTLQPYKSAGIKSETARALDSLRKQLINEGDNATYALSDFDKVFAIRKELRDTISSLYTQGKSEQARTLKSVRVAMDAALSSSNSDYAKAMEDFARQSRTMDAVEAGAQMARPGTRAADVATDFGLLGGDEQAAARVGYGDKLLAKTESQVGASNRARPLTSPKIASDVQTAAIDPDLFSRRIAREMDMFETRNRALGGSLTADNMQDVADLQAYDMSVLGNILTGRRGDAARQLSAAASNVVTGMNEATRKKIADALLSRDTVALRKALAQVESEAARKEIYNVILRTGVIRGVDPNTLLERLGQ